jgi:hypothetical protein
LFSAQQLPLWWQHPIVGLYLNFNKVSLSNHFYGQPQVQSLQLLSRPESFVAITFVNPLFSDMLLAPYNPSIKTVSVSAIRK